MSSSLGGGGKGDVFIVLKGKALSLSHEFSVCTYIIFENTQLLWLLLSHQKPCPSVYLENNN